VVCPSFLPPPSLHHPLLLLPFLVSSASLTFASGPLSRQREGFTLSRYGLCPPLQLTALWPQDSGPCQLQ
jgi:hypothetical protein